MKIRGIYCFSRLNRETGYFICKNDEGANFVQVDRQIPTSFGFLPIVSHMTIFRSMSSSPFSFFWLLITSLLKLLSHFLTCSFDLWSRSGISCVGSKNNPNVFRHCRLLVLYSYVSRVGLSIDDFNCCVIC